LPLTSKLFPYTTLFRSKLKIENLSLEDFEDKAIEEQRKILIYGILKVGFAKIIYEFEQEVTKRKEKVNELIEQIEVMAKQFFSRDRKSTRLNSSHVSIS